MNESPTDQNQTLDPDQVEQLRRLLGTVKDWLLHTSFEVREDLGRFLTGLGWSSTGPEQLVTWLINDLGDQTITLRRGTHTADGTTSP